MTLIFPPCFREMSHCWIMRPSDRARGVPPLAVTVEAHFGSVPGARPCSVVVALMITPHTTLLALMPGTVLFGLGVGFASSQLTNVILSEIDPDKAGVASGTNTTVRQVGAALGIAVIGSLLNAQAIHHAVKAVNAVSGISERVRTSTIAGIRAQGVNFAPGSGIGRDQAAVLTHALRTSVVDGARPALLFAALVVALGALLSLLIPADAPVPAELPAGTEPTGVGVAVELL